MSLTPLCVPVLVCNLGRDRGWDWGSRAVGGLMQQRVPKSLSLSLRTGKSTALCPNPPRPGVF